MSVNQISLEYVTHEDAVTLIASAVDQSSEILLRVAKVTRYTEQEDDENDDDNENEENANNNNYHHHYNHDDNNDQQAKSLSKMQIQDSNYNKTLFK